MYDMTLKAREHMTEATRRTLHEVLDRIQGGTLGIAGIAHHAEGQLHHGGVHNTKGNRGKYPLLMHTPLNIWKLSPAFHTKNSGYGRYPEETAQLLEEILKKILDLSLNHTVETPRLLASIGMVIDLADDFSGQKKREVYLV